MHVAASSHDPEDEEQPQIELDNPILDHSSFPSNVPELEPRPTMSHYHLSPTTRLSDRLGPSPLGDLSISDGSTRNDGYHALRRDEAWSKQEFPEWMSACSEEGVAWVCGATGSCAFSRIAERFIKSFKSSLTAGAGPTMSSQRAEPIEATAWEYVNGESSEIFCMKSVPRLTCR